MADLTPLPDSFVSSSENNAAVQELMKRVGARVREARERKGIARRVLSERSGVSPRYLAQLEAGDGNISIGRLKQVAQALDHRIEWFVGEDDPWTSETIRMADLFRASDAATQSRIMRILNPAPSAEARAHRVCLVGLRGAGKSTLGRGVSEALDLPFIELNSEIEALAGMPISEIMALYGQEGYRKLEGDALDGIVASHKELILAVGGGIVSEPATYTALMARFHTVWIKASPEEHMDRVRGQGDERPMAGNPAAMAQLRSILTSREVLYEQAEAMLDTSGVSAQTSLSQLITLLKDHQFLS